jgi:uncharacterized protein
MSLRRQISGSTPSFVPIAACELTSAPPKSDQGAATLQAFADKVDTKKCGRPRFLAVITGFGLGYVRPDEVQVIPIGALGP